jgi:DeoR/GlpR family transcriptional regulator of sugar metabolism
MASTQAKSEVKVQMLAEVRREKIVEEVTTLNHVTVSQLSKLFGLTEETIRKDLDILDNQWKLKRIHGGAVSVSSRIETPYEARRQLNVEEKQRIAEKALRFIDDGDTIFVDISSTVMFLVRKLAQFNNLTVVTNSARAVVELLELNTENRLNIISTGGLLREASCSFIGPLTMKVIKEYNADKLFASCTGIGIKHGLTDSNYLEHQVKSVMVERAEETIILADHTKFKQAGLVKFADLKDVDMIISDDSLDESIRREFEEYGVSMF